MVSVICMLGCAFIAYKLTGVSPWVIVGLFIGMIVAMFIAALRRK